MSGMSLLCGFTICNETLIVRRAPQNLSIDKNKINIRCTTH
jgi:hypothetical protein